jgi:hypothetical protein
METAIQKFATENKLRVKKDGSGDDAEFVIEGRIGESTISQYGDAELCVAFITTGKLAPRTGLFNTFKEACLAAGMTLRQSGDAEGLFSFDPQDPKQARVAIRGIRAKAKRRMSPEQAAAGAARLAQARLSRSLGQIHT